MSRRLRTLSTAISLIVAGAMPLSASAGGVYLLQLGSFGSRNEAQALWESLKGKYPELFSGFSARFQEVQLPPDNFVVYRTQAGALEDRSDAQTVCDRLNSRGDECYVVETAMFRPDLMPEQSAELAIVNPATQQQVGSVKVPQPEMPEDLGQMPEVETIARIEPQLPVDKLPQPAVQAPNVEATAIGVAKPEVRTTIINPAEQKAMISKPALKAMTPSAPQVDISSAQELAALPDVEAPKPFTVEVKPAPVTPEVSVQPPQMQMPQMQTPAIQTPTIQTPSIQTPAMKAPTMSAPSVSAPSIATPSVSAPAVMAPSIAAPSMSVQAPSFSPAPRMPAQPEDDGESFWSMMDPFASDGDEVQPMQTVEVEEEEGWFDSVFGSDEDERDVNFPPAPQATASIDPSPLDPNWGMGETVAAPFTLPPPPSPNNDMAMAHVAQERIEANRRKSGVATPLTTEPFAKAPHMSQMPMQQPPAVPAMPKPIAPALAGKPRDGRADVEVAEAIRVPLTQNQQPMIDLAPKYPTAGELKKLGKPSGDMKNQSIWAQIYHFESEQMALAYWDAFKAENPTFPTMRIRVTRPYDKTLAGNGKVSLRVGPFENAKLIQDVCAEVANDKISCKPMAEIGSTGIAQFDRKTYLPSRYDKAGIAEKYSVEPMYWVQLGSFDSEGTAKKEWSTLRTQHKPLLDGATVNVASPIMSSAMEPVYRLRTGPYAMRTGADKLCAGMRAHGTECIVVFSR
ncbi:MAG: SPOR domain-containing protein [Rickettsiales bacterium]|nr:SPOR domain-containing protein [Rickettsiales bacterium]